MTQNGGKTSKTSAIKKSELKTPIKKVTVAPARRLALNHNENLVAR